jgi:hypothetical protein
VIGPNGAELGRCRLSEQRADQSSEIVGVSADCGVRRLPEVLVIANAATHHVGRQHSVLAEQRLQLQGSLQRRGREGVTGRCRRGVPDVNGLLRRRHRG